MNRREFLKSVGVLATVAAVTPSLSGVKFASSSGSSPPGDPQPEEKIVKTTCVNCVNFCGLDVKVVDGVIRGIYTDKNRAEYYNFGLCPKGPAAVFTTYNPYRLKVPLKRTNPNKGPDEDPGWVEISWEEAFDIIVQKLQQIRDSDPRKLIWQHGHGKYLIGDKFPKAFASAFGTPNVVHRTTTCEAARHVADEITWGYHGILPDLEYCNYLLNLGAEYFVSEQWAGWLKKAVLDAKERGMKLVVVEPRLSNLAAKADEWVPIRPGKDVVFLLAMANVLIQNGLIDEEFLVNYTNAPYLVGEDGKFLKDENGNPLVWDTVTNSAKPFEEGVQPALSGSYEIDGKTYRTAFQVLADEVSEITPEHASEICGVPAETIERVALEFGREAKIGSTIVIDGVELRYRPVAIHSFRGLAAKEYGVQNWRAALIVQMLVGCLDAVGGLILHSPYKKPSNLEPSKCEYPPNRVDLQESVFFPHSTHNVCQQVALTLQDPAKYGLDYTPEMQIVYATNRLFSTSDTMQQIEGYKNIFTVVIDVVLTEMAWMADIVLPDLTFLEVWHFSPTRWTPGTKHYAIRQPVVDNVYDIPYEAYSIIWELAKRLGIRDEYIEQINSKWGLKNVKFETGRDYTAREAVEIIWRDKTGQDFDVAVEKGFYGKFLSVEERYLNGVEAKFKGPGKPKIHLYCEELIEDFEKISQIAQENGLDIDLEKYRVALSPLPKEEHAFPTPHKEAQGYDFYLITFKRMYRNQSGNTSTNPLLAKVSHDAEENYLWINRKVAEEMGIKDGQYVYVESRVGKIRARAKLTEGIRPDTVGLSYHYGQWSPGYPEFARKGAWTNKILELHPDIISGMNSFNDTKVKVYK